MLTAQPCPRQIHTISSLPYDLNVYFHRRRMKFSMFARNLMGTTDLGGLVPYCTAILYCVAWPGLSGAVNSVISAN